MDNKAVKDDDDEAEKDNDNDEAEENNDNESFSEINHEFATLPPEVLLYMYKKDLASIVFDNSNLNLFMCLLSPYFGNNIKQYTALFQQIIEVAPNNENAYNIQL
jgi:hypothetical protein